ncbi:MAG: hypothetical protein H7Y09_07370 [Chitinophagaceae bacterium]|nr:hypothetical protein [Anaerolineae bacterium]
MATRRKIDYPDGLDKIAEEFGVSTPELLDEIVNGDLIIMRPSVSDEELAADDALWDEQFAASQDVLDKLAANALAKYQAGMTEEFDPDTDPDLQ